MTPLALGVKGVTVLQSKLSVPKTLKEEAAPFRVPFSGWQTLACRPDPAHVLF